MIGCLPEDLAADECAEPEDRCWTAELALMKPPRRRRSTLPVIIASAAVIRPALLSMNVPIMPTTRARGTRGKLVIRPINATAIKATAR